MDFDIRVEEGAEEGEALYVVHVEMAQKDVDTPLLFALVSQCSYPAPGVEYELRPGSRGQPTRCL